MLEESTGNFSASRNVYDWYQNNTHVILNIMIKNLTEQDVKVRLIDETLDVACTLANTDEYRLHFNLFKPIYVAESSWTVTPSKLEIKLKKTDRKRWQSLEVIPEKGCKRPPSFAGVVSAADLASGQGTPAKQAALDSPSAADLNDDMPAAVGKLKYDWYQTESHVMVSVLIRNLNENDVKVQFSESSVELDCKLPTGEEQKLHLDIFKLINPQESTVKVSVSKLEMRLKKVDAGRWSKLELDSASNFKQTTVVELATDGETEDALSGIPEIEGHLEPVPESCEASIKDESEQQEEQPESLEEPLEEPTGEPQSELVDAPVSEPTQEHEPEDVVPEPTQENEPEEAASEPTQEPEQDDQVPSKSAATAEEPKSWDNNIVKEFEEAEKVTVNGNGSGGGNSVESPDELYREIYEKGGEEVRRAMAGKANASWNTEAITKEKHDAKVELGL